MASGGAYFEHRKGEVSELRALLRNVKVEKDPARKREVIKKVIAYMTLGVDVSRLFSEMVLASHTTDLVQKKMVYLYLCTYAEAHADLSLLAINTLHQDCRSEDPMVRGLALRSLCSLRLPSIVEYLIDPVKASLGDRSAYVRKTGVIGVLKLFHLSPESVEGSDMVDTLYNMIKDPDPQVIVNCVRALEEIMASEGGMAINQSIIYHLLNRIRDFNEWAQCTVLEVVCRYTPVSKEEMFDIMNLLDDCLRVSNSAVVLACTKCFLHYTESYEDVHVKVYKRLKTPLLTLMGGGGFENEFCVLSHIRIMVERCEGVFDDEFKQFFCRYNEPSHVKYIKLDVLPLVANEENMAELVAELAEYVADVDSTLSRRAIRSIGQVAARIPFGADKIMEQLLEFLDLDIDYVRAETVVVMKDLLRKYPERIDDVIPSLKRALKRVEDAEGKAAVLFMIGEYGHMFDEAPYLLESMVERWEEESAVAVRLELLTATMKLFFKRPPEVQSTLGRVLAAAMNDDGSPDVHDRALLYYRMLQADLPAARRVVASEKAVIEEFTEERLNELKDSVFAEFNTLSVVYGEPSSMFIPEENQVTELIDDEEEDAFADAAAKVDVAAAAPVAAAAAPVEVAAAGGGGGAPDLDDIFGAGVPAAAPAAAAAAPVPAAAAFTVVKTALDAPSFQAKWMALAESAKFDDRVAVVPTPADMERALAEANISVMASGDTGAAIKGYFFAADGSGGLHLVEVTLEKAGQRLVAVVKSEDAAKGADFLNAFTTALQPVLGGGSGSGSGSGSVDPFSMF